MKTKVVSIGLGVALILTTFGSSVCAQTRLLREDFHDPKFSGWTTMESGGLRTNVNEQLVISARCGPLRPNDLFANHFIFGHEIATPSVLTNNWTVEGRAELVRASQNDAWASVHFLWRNPGGTGYILWKDADEVALVKFWNGGSAMACFFYDRGPLQNTNVTLVLTLTRRDSSLVINSRVLDKGNVGAILFERTVIDTARSDPVVPRDGSRVPGVADLAGEPWRLVSGPGYIEATLDWVNAEQGPVGAAEVVYDNMEAWLYPSPLPGELNVARTRTGLELSWEDPKARPEQAPTLRGPWQLMLTTNSSCPVQLSSATNAGSGFYRLKTPPPGRKWLTAAAVTMMSQANIETNLQTFYARMAEAAARGANLIVFPEAALQGCPGWRAEAIKPSAEELAYTRQTAETIPGPGTDLLVAKARELGIYVVFGMTEKGSAGTLYNTAVFLGPDGVIGAHRKSVLVGNESSIWQRGAQLIEVFDSPLGRVGLLICAELGGESLSENTAPGPRLAAAGADLLVTSAAWWTSTIDLWEAGTLGNARVAGRWHVVSNQVGLIGHAQCCGRSRVVAPSGQLASDTQAREGLALWQTDLIIDE